MTLLRVNDINCNNNMESLAEQIVDSNGNTRYFISNLSNHPDIDTLTDQVGRLTNRTLYFTSASNYYVNSTLSSYLELEPDGNTYDFTLNLSNYHNIGTRTDHVGTLTNRSTYTSSILTDYSNSTSTTYRDLAI
ncbi:hypothetical protein TpMuguga_02g02325 [Theileria parva strain Muguga]|uniref:uncharacterized protein n=1 Tax=Theileria parva strain Muguga TaxID=333668 RepID=UPI001C619A80|nr:uncharacterized protein TpMuguga_02g02325 [Theileria parva strain Muguga]KAF5153564.1 hypothetical protein TpMuguga_02g02325 [Theileria parva strain Muguga]